MLVGTTFRWNNPENWKILEILKNPEQLEKHENLENPETFEQIGKFQKKWN